MSLKEFHIVFITASILLALGFSYWGYAQYQNLHQSRYAIASIGSLLSAAGLMVYEISFIRKTKT